MKFHRTGQKRLHHPVVAARPGLRVDGALFDTGLQLNVYTAAAGTPTADALKLLASWAASQNDLPTESVATPAT
jgi:hypothetical protein